MNNYLHQQYVETRAKFNKFSARLEKSQERGEFQKFSTRKQHFLLSRVKKLWEKLRLLEVQLKIASAGISMALLLMVNNVSAQQFVEAPDKNPMPTPTIFGGRFYMADLDGDSDLDILTSSYNGDIWYFANVGTTSDPDFEKVPDSESPFDELHENNNLHLYEIHDAADIDNDGDIDLLLSETLLRNTGSNDSIVYDPESNQGVSRFGDIDGDGDLDGISFNQEDGVVINENIGNASDFTISGANTNIPVMNWDIELSYISDFEVFDLDKDGDLDLLLSSELYVDYSTQQKTFLITNTGTSESPAFTLESDENNPYANHGAWNIHIGDLDADGDFDLIMESDTYMFSFYEFKANGLEENRELIPELYDGIILPYSYMAPQFVDFDGDGDLDIFAGTETEIEYYEQVSSSGQSKFLRREDIQAPFIGDDSQEQFLSFGDIDGDGDADVMYYTTEYDDITYNTYDVYKLYENTGTAINPVFEEKQDAGFDNLEDFFASSFVDIDADGDMDLFMVGWEKTDGDWHMSTKYYENTGEDPFEFMERSGFNSNPLFGISDVYYEDVYYAVLDFTDLDNDGDYDVVFTGYYGKIYFIENIGTAAEAQYVDHTNESPFWGLSAGYFGSVSLADVDGDGDDDLFIHHYYGMLTTYYENTSNPQTGLPKINKSSHLELFPNPVVNQLNVKFPGTLEGPFHYEILGIEGRSVQNGEIQDQSGLNRYTVDTESLHSGYYLLKIKSENHSYISKFVKQ